MVFAASRILSAILVHVSLPLIFIFSNDPRRNCYSYHSKLKTELESAYVYTEHFIKTSIQDWVFSTDCFTSRTYTYTIYIAEVNKISMRELQLEKFHATMNIINITSIRKL